MTASKSIYEIDGLAFATLEGFYENIDSRLGLAPWGWNLDAFNDILRGGFGTPDEGFVLRWINHEVSRERLGYDETVRQLRKRLRSCHRDNIPWIEAELATALRHEGQTVFDWLLDIIRRHGPDGEEQEDGVELVLQ